MRNIVGFLLLVHFFNYIALFLTESPENHKRDRFKGRKKLSERRIKTFKGSKILHIWKCKLLSIELIQRNFILVFLKHFILNLLNMQLLRVSWSMKIMSRSAKMNAEIETETEIEIETETETKMQKYKQNSSSFKVAHKLCRDRSIRGNPFLWKLG